MMPLDAQNRYTDMAILTKITENVFFWHLFQNGRQQYVLHFHAKLHFTASSNMRQAWSGMTALMRTPNFIEIFLTFPEMWTFIFQKPAAAAILFLKIIIMVALCNRADHYILPCDFFLSSFYLFLFLA